MRVLDNSELQAQEFVKHTGRKLNGGASGEVMLAVRNLEPLQAIKVEVNDWHLKTPLNAFVNQATRSQRTDKKYSVRTLQAGGWVVIRVA